MPAKPATKSAGGRPPGTGRKITTYFYAAEVAALDRLAIEERAPRARIIAELAVERLVDLGRLVRDEYGEVKLPGAEAAGEPS